LGKLAELVLIAGPVLGFAIYELVKLRRDAKAAKAEASRDRQT
jgi:heme/copper-type cytochrome/quinol oxidase subunit 2